MSQLYVDPTTQKRYTARTLRVYNIDLATVQPLSIVKPSYNARTHQLIDLQTATQDNAGNYLVDFDVRLKSTEQLVQQIDLHIQQALKKYQSQPLVLSDGITVINTEDTLDIFKAVLKSKLSSSNITLIPRRPYLLQGNLDHITPENAQAKHDQYLGELSDEQSKRQTLADTFKEHLLTLSAEDFLTSIGSHGQHLETYINTRHNQLYSA